MMQQNNYDFVLKQGSTFTKHITWENSSGNIADLTGATARMHLRRKIIDSEIALDLTTENGRIVLGGVAGTVDLYISAEDTAALSGKYVYDLEIVYTTDNVWRLLQGTITIDPEVTR